MIFSSNFTLILKNNLQYKLKLYVHVNKTPKSIFKPNTQRKLLSLCSVLNRVIVKIELKVDYQSRFLSNPLKIIFTSKYHSILSIHIPLKMDSFFNFNQNRSVFPRSSSNFTIFFPVKEFFLEFYMKNFIRLSSGI